LNTLNFWTLNLEPAYAEIASAGRPWTRNCAEPWTFLFCRILILEEIRKVVSAAVLSDYALTKINT
jgi:hypothetical protein